MDLDTCVCVSVCVYVRKTCGHRSKTDRREGKRSNHRGHMRRHKLSLLTILPFLGLVYRTSGLRKVHLLSFTSSGSLCTCFRHERWDQYSVRRHKRGTEPQSVYFFRERFSCVYVFLCANSQRVAATLKTSIPLQWCVQTFVKHHVCVWCFLFCVHPIFPPHDPFSCFPSCIHAFKRVKQLIHSFEEMLIKKHKKKLYNAFSDLLYSCLYALSFVAFQWTCNWMRREPFNALYFLSPPPSVLVFHLL